MKRNRPEEGDESVERGAKMSISELENFAKKLKANAEQRAEANKKSGEGMDVDFGHHQGVWSRIVDRVRREV